MLLLVDKEILKQRKRLRERKREAKMAVKLPEAVWSQKAWEEGAYLHGGCENEHELGRQRTRGKGSRDGKWSCAEKGLCAFGEVEGTEGGGLGGVYRSGRYKKEAVERERGLAGHTGPSGQMVKIFFTSESAAFARF